MKYISLGLLVSALGAVGFVIAVVLTALTVGYFREIANFFGIVAVSGLPVGILLWIMQKFRKKSE